MSNVDGDELARFEAVADHWWDPHGAFAALHAINPLRADYIGERAAVDGRSVLDVGCGGGILCEELARRGARVSGVDASAPALAAAREHLAVSDLQVEYLEGTAESLAAGRAAAYDVVTCLEMLEHVPEPAAVVEACAELVSDGGDVFFSTLNRNPKSYALAIVGAEYLLRLLPPGTHDYTRFIRPSELASWARDAGLEVLDVTGLHYDPLTRRYSLGGNVDVNYLMHLRPKR